MTPLEQLKSSRMVWTANEQSADKSDFSALKQAELDLALQGGLAKHGLVYIQVITGSGELSFLRPIIQNALQNEQSGQYIALINPPGLPNTDWFNEHICHPNQLFFVRSKNNAENLWAFEQCLMSGVCSTVVAWGLEANEQQLRRCHLRATQHGCQAIWFSDPRVQLHKPQSPCSAQLSVYKQNHQWFVDVLKQQGGWPNTGIQITHPMPFTNAAINRTLHPSALSLAINT